ISRGGSPTTVRKFFVSGGLFAGVLIYPAALVDDRNICVVILVIASLCYGLCSSNLWAVTQTLAGPAASGKWTGLQNGFGNLAGGVAPTFTGFVVEATGSFQLAFLSVAVMLICGAICFAFVIGPVKETTWSTSPYT